MHLFKNCSKIAVNFSSVKHLLLECPTLVSYGNITSFCLFPKCRKCLKLCFSSNYLGDWMVVVFDNLAYLQELAAVAGREHHLRWTLHT